jgi:hypothetical protein
MTSMQILTDAQSRVLSFVEACNSAGYRPTTVEVEVWMASPTRRLPVSRLSRIVTSNLANSVAGLRPLFETEPGTGETHVAHARRLGWLVGTQQLQVSRLGLALLQSARRQDVAAQEASVLVLDSEDPLAYAVLFGKLAAVDGDLLVDPYLRVTEMRDVIDYTDVRRVLISSRPRNTRETQTAIAVYLASLEEAEVEVRTTASRDVHDRVVISTDGSAHLLGTSLNSIGSASTHLVTLPTDAANAQALKAETWWNEATPLDQAPLPAE